MRTFAILTLGCKVNQYESAQIRQFLEGRGLASVKPVEKPDLFVINTCFVTATATSKSRIYINRAEQLNPAAERVICGCLATLQRSELHCEDSNTTHLISDRTELTVMLNHIIGGPLSGESSSIYSHKLDIGQSSNIKAENQVKVNNKTDLSTLPNLPLLTCFKEQTRAFLKVQDGCDALCSYCIIPKVRPIVQSKSVEEAVFEAKTLVAAGHKEIVVTGVNLGALGRETARGYKKKVAGYKLLVSGYNEQRTMNAEPRTLNLENPTLNKTALSILIGRLAEVEGLCRLRVSSLEPGDITEGLLDVFCKYPNMMPHIHLSVQSGSDNVLKRMCRPYSAEELREKISMIKGRLDRPAITCDMIVGFPGETEEEFQETIELAKWAEFSKIHVFPFSVRAGTAAAMLKGRVDSKVIKLRAEILRKLSDELGYKFREQFIGENCEVLIEGSRDKQVVGHCERYFLVNCRLSNVGCRFNKNEIVRVKITAVTSEGAIGEEVER